MERFKGRRALVTGGGGALGRAVVGRLQVEGAAVTVADRHDPQIPGCAFLSLDLTDAGRVASALTAIDPLDAVVHVAGGFTGGMRAWDADAGDLQKMLALNVETAWNVARAALPAMVAAGDGRLVMIGARPAVQPVDGLAAYGASKAALTHLVQTLALETRASGVTVNAVLPSVIDTPVNREAMAGADFERWVKPESLAAVIAFLCSADAADVSGALIPVYGRS